MTNQSLKNVSVLGGFQDGASQSSKALSNDFWEVIRSLPQGTENNLVHSLFSLQAPKQREVYRVYMIEDKMVRKIVKVIEAFEGKPRNQRLISSWNAMDSCLVRYMAAYHRLLEKLDWAMQEETEQDQDLIQLGLDDYGKYDDALVSLAKLITGNINSGHNLALELSLEKAKGSTNDNLQRHLSQISLHSQPDTENQTPTHSNLLELNDVKADPS